LFYNTQCKKGGKGKSERERGKEGSKKGKRIGRGKEGRKEEREVQREGRRRKSLIHLRKQSGKCSLR
jgi:hypothetical protein